MRTIGMIGGMNWESSAPGAERFWVEEGSHLGFWLNPHAAQAQAAAREFLGRHRPWRHRALAALIAHADRGTPGIASWV